MKNGVITALLIIAAVIFVLSFLGSEGCAVMTPVPDDPAVVVVDEQADCAEACANMEVLEYPGWDGSPGPDRRRGTDDDLSCAQVCEEVEGSGDGFSWNTPCVASARSIEQVDSCSAEE